jgi:hypothetical protein
MPNGANWLPECGVTLPIRDKFAFALTGPNRETLKIGYDQCSISSKTEIFQKLDEIIATAKKKNKL